MKEKDDQGADAAAVAFAGSSDTSQLPRAIPDGGAAFPTLEVYARFNDDRGRYEEHYAPHGGMSLRDWFAGKAMQAYISKLPVGAITDCSDIDPASVRVTAADGESVRIGVARVAYQYADAMLKQREGK